MAGLLPKNRGRGLGKKLYLIIEEYAKNKNFFRITLSTHNDRREMLALAIKNKYRIIETDQGEYGDNIKIRLEKQINTKNELRILLTEKCNYKCFFCHSEGLDAEGGYPKCSKEDIALRISEAMELGYNDITFTGGEPLIRKNDIIYLIEKCNKYPNPPNITIVSNALLIDNPIIEASSSYKGNFKFNISMHCLDAKIYSKITKVKVDNYYTVLKNIKKVTDAGIKVKLNCVILKGFNTENDYLSEHLKIAYELGANTVKFLELLVIKDNENFFKYFYNADTICTKLKELSAFEKSRTIRGTTFSHPSYNGLNIEVTKCTCKFGCSKCMDIRDRTLGPDLEYYPCFVQSDKPVCINSKRNMEGAFKIGNRIINSYAAKFKSDSPILIAQDKYLKTRSELFFQTDFSFEDCDKILENMGFKHAKTRAFSLFYYRPIAASDEWLNFNKILKFGYDSHTPKKIEFIFSKHKYTKTEEGIFWAEQSFIEDLLPPYCGSLEQAREIMQSLDFEQYFQYDYEFAEYKNQDLTISLDKKSKNLNFKVKYQNLSVPLWQNLLKQLNARIITKPFTKWFIENNKKSTK